MSLQFNAACEIQQFLSKEEIPSVIIGGIALQHWGQPRFTRDVDVTIVVDYYKEEMTLQKILSVFSPRISDALDFALQNRICLVYSSEGCEIDISLGIAGYEEEVIRRAVKWEITEGCYVKICSPEDLIIHKAISGRPQDISDIESIIVRQKKNLDTDYIRAWLKEFALLLEQSEISDRFEDHWTKKNSTLM